MRYGNDLQLTELARQLKNEMASLDDYLTNGLLDAAFLRAHTMGKRIDQFMDRLNELKYFEQRPQENTVAAERE